MSQLTRSTTHPKSQSPPPRRATYGLSYPIAMHLVVRHYDWGWAPGEATFVRRQSLEVLRVETLGKPLPTPAYLGHRRQQGHWRPVGQRGSFLLEVAVADGRLERSSSGGLYVAEKKPTLTEDGNGWVVRLETSDGKVQQYRCSSEAQGKQLIATLLLRTEEPPNKPQSD